MYWPVRARWLHEARILKKKETEERDDNED
jgi:hypothetical protein